MALTAEQKDELEYWRMKKESGEQPVATPGETAEPAAPQEAEPHEEKQHVHNPVLKDGMWSCADGSCGDKFLDVKGPGDLIDALNRDYHKKHNLLNCPTCKKDVFDHMTKAGGSWEEKGDDIVIHRGLNGSAQQPKPQPQQPQKGPGRVV